MSIEADRIPLQSRAEPARDHREPPETTAGRSGGRFLLKSQ